jgi:hypothetical protein
VLPGESYGGDRARRRARGRGRRCSGQPYRDSRRADHRLDVTVSTGDRSHKLTPAELVDAADLLPDCWRRSTPASSRSNTPTGRALLQRLDGAALAVELAVDITPTPQAVPVKTTAKATRAPRH